MPHKIELVKGSDVKEGMTKLDQQFKPFNFMTLDFTPKKKKK
ncbi:hypothetical protein LCGC14_0571370 [marine sediment metagenome]|uniref:Uncharacterized protein n=1 Tax=marine sediment metagenome TaxID=412755 RepID=A0A0F9RPA2_9ZZZZ